MYTVKLLKIIMEKYNKIRIRHILCIIGFNSHWYNKKTIRRFTRFQQEILHNKHQIITLTNTCDTICDVCPYYKDTLCKKTHTSHKEYTDIDTYLAEELVLDLYKYYNIDTIIPHILDNITSQHFHHACQYCSFKKLCHIYISRVLLDKTS